MTTPEKLLMDLAAAVRLGDDALIERAVGAAIEAGEALLDGEEPPGPDEPEGETSSSEAPGGAKPKPSGTERARKANGPESPAGPDARKSAYLKGGRMVRPGGLEPPTF